MVLLLQIFLLLGIYKSISIVWESGQCSKIISFSYPSCSNRFVNSAITPCKIRFSFCSKWTELFMGSASPTGNCTVGRNLLPRASPLGFAPPGLLGGLFKTDVSWNTPVFGWEEFRNPCLVLEKEAQIVIALMCKVMDFKLSSCRSPSSNENLRKQFPIDLYLYFKKCFFCHSFHSCTCSFVIWLTNTCATGAGHDFD